MIIQIPYQSNPVGCFFEINFRNLINNNNQKTTTTITTPLTSSRQEVAELCQSTRRPEIPNLSFTCLKIRSWNLKFHQNFIALSISRLASFCFNVSRLSYVFLPRTNAISNLASPESVIKSFKGTIVKPVSFVFRSSF